MYEPDCYFVIERKNNDHVSKDFVKSLVNRTHNYGSYMLCLYQKPDLPEWALLRFFPDEDEKGCTDKAISDLNSKEHKVSVISLDTMFEWMWCE